MSNTSGHKATVGDKLPEEGPSGVLPRISAKYMQHPDRPAPEHEEVTYTVIFDEANKLPARVYYRSMKIRARKASYWAWMPYRAEWIEEPDKPEEL
jgi:hypothetical protein